MGVPIDRFYIKEDVRASRDHVGAIALSIQQHGLLHPIVVREDKDGRYEVCAGRVRFTAMKDILEWKELEPQTHFRIAPPDTDSLVIQLIENYYRKDLSVEETAELVRQIHERHSSKYGKAVKGPGKGGWTLEDTARLLGITTSYVSVLLAYTRLPEDVRKKCKTVRDIKDALANQKKKKLMAKIAEKVASTPTPVDLTPWLKGLKHGDALKLIREVPDESVDLIYTDPPYGINLDELREGSYEDKPDEYEQLMKAIVPEFYRVMKEGFIIVWCAFHRFDWLSNLLTSAGFTVNRTPIVWAKGQRIHTEDPTKQLSNVCEIAVYGWKGNPTIARAGETNLFVYTPLTPQERIHVAQRPDDLSAHIIEIFSFEGDVVLDAFVGSGSTIRACIKTNRKFIGFEKDKETYDKAVMLTKEVCGCSS